MNNVLKIDCRNLPCPEPIIKTKNAIEEANYSDVIEISTNSKVVFENIKKFLNSQNQDFSTTQITENEFLISTIKTKNLKNKQIQDYSCQIDKINNKVIYLSENKIGSGSVGEVLLSKILNAFSQLDTKPYAVLCLNDAVYLTTNRANPSFNTLRNLQNAGTKILSCGSCLEAYKLIDKLGVGETTNAFEVAEILNKYEVIKL